MPFGGLGGALPLRLGPDPELGWSAEQHARFCADLVAVSRTMPAFVESIGTDLGSTPAHRAMSHVGRNGDGLANSLALNDTVGGVCTVEMGAYSNVYGEVETAPDVIGGWVALVYVLGSFGVVGTTPGADSAAFGFTTSLSPDQASAFIWGAGRSFDIGDYGGHTAKRNSTTEGDSTYAWQWYQYLRDCQGSAYSARDDSVRGWESKAQARALGTSQRISEMLAASSTPGGSDAKLGRWAAILNVQRGTNPKWKVRQDCEAIAQRPSAPTHAYLIAALNDILSGVAVVSDIVHSTGTMTAWPDATYWPGIVNGDAIYDLGRGVFSSSRGRLTLVVSSATSGRYPYPIGGSELEYLMSRDVTRFMDRVLPATAEWAWDASGGTGFILDTSELDLTAL